MRKIILLFICIIPFLTKAQSDSTFEFKKIDSSTDKKNELYTKAKIWITGAFKSAKDVIQMDDKDAGRIVAKGLYKTPVKAAFGNVIGYDYVNFTVSIDVKDFKYRMVLSSFTHEAGSYKGSASGGDLSNEKPACGTFFMTKKRFNLVKEEARQNANDLLTQFSLAMKKTLPKDEF